MAGARGGVRIRRTRAQWLALVEAYAESGLSLRAFCAQRGVSARSFAQARRRCLAEVNGSGVELAARDFVEVPVPQLEGEDGAWEVELALGGEVVLRLRRR